MTTSVGAGIFRLEYTKSIFFGIVMPAAVDVTGKRFGRLVAIKVSQEKDASGRTRRVWECVCDCGNTVFARVAQLTAGKVLSCGCFSREITSKRSITHGMTGTKVYAAWKGIKRRCLTPSEPSYKNYGGRGISIHPDWSKDFMSFYREIGDPPSESHTVDRIDNEKGYVPGNVRWATMEEQQRNKRSNVFYEYNGESLMLGQLAEKYGISFSTLAHRLITKGWSVNDAIETPVRSKGEKRTVHWQGKQWAIADLAREYGSDYRILLSRILSGWPVEDALAKPVRNVKRNHIYEFNGQSGTISEWSKILGIDMYTLYSRIHRHKWSVEKAFTTPVRRQINNVRR